MHLTVLSLDIISPSRSIVDQARYMIRSTPGPPHQDGLFPPAIGLGSQGIRFLLPVVLLIGFMRQSDRFSLPRWQLLVPLLACTRSTCCTCSCSRSYMKGQLWVASNTKRSTWLIMPSSYYSDFHCKS